MFFRRKVFTMKFIGVLAILMVVAAGAQGGEYTERFLTLYNTIVDSNSGYFSKEGIPYHTVETLMVESVDYGHETDSEAQSYNVWLKAMYGAISGDFSHFNEAWNVIDGYYVPETQYNNEKYNPEAGGESNGVSVGIDPLGAELTATYGDSRVRVMHWLLDVDNVYGFGNVQGKCEEGPSQSGPSFVNNGPGSVWQGITYPTCDTFKYGGDVGFSWYATVPNWGYSAAPDADARAILAAFWASQWATEQGKLGDISATLSKAAELGDYLRYTLFDKHFKHVGNCIGGTNCPAGTGKDSAHYLISWYIGWGGSIDSSGGYSWRMASSEGHIGYQNPVAAYALANDPNLRPQSASAVEDWQNALERQLELYQWVQTSDGPLGGGVTNSWNNAYEEPPSDVQGNTFHGMWYMTQPGYDGASDWFGMQSWTADRLAQYYYLTGDATAKSVLDKWINWVISHSTVSESDFSIPITLSWSGSTPSDASATMIGSGHMIGIGSSIARTMIYYSAKSGDATSKAFAKGILDAIWANFRDSIGTGVPSTVNSLSNVNTQVYIPISGWSGSYPNGDQINSSSTFISIRSWYKNDPNWSQVESYLNGGPAPTITYHRFWEQADLALAMGAYGMLFNE